MQELRLYYGETCDKEDKVEKHGLLQDLQYAFQKDFDGKLLVEVLGILDRATLLANRR